MRILPFLALGLTACPHPSVTRQLEELDARVVMLETQIAQQAAPAQADEEVQAAAEQVGQAIEAGEYARAVEIVREVQQKHPRHPLTQRLAQAAEEWAIIGQPAGELVVEEWYQGEATFADAPVTMVVFWELWCPHCRNHMPKLEEKAQQYADRGLQVVALTRLTRDVQESDVRAYMAEHGLTYPIARETGEMSERYRIRGIPAAALVRDGEVVWRGHPAQLEDGGIDAYLP